MTRCSNCQTENKPTSKFCGTCGLELQKPAYTKPLDAEDLPVAARSTMPLDETAAPPLLDDLTPEFPPSDANWDGKVQLIAQPFEPLPEGALLGNYVVKQQLEGRPGVHHYYVGDVEETAVSILKESSDWKKLRAEIELVNRELDPAGLQLPLYAFQQRVGVMRYYVLLPASGTSIEKLPMPIETPQALAYGASLAEGLATLHSQHIAFGLVETGRIVVAEEEARWSDFVDCLLPGNPQRYALEVEQLTAVLYTLLTGQRQYVPQNNLLPALQPLFARVLGQRQPMTAVDLAQELTNQLAAMRRPDNIDFRVGRQTDVGMQRQLNEDSLCTFEMVWNNQSINSPIGVYVVADGMGGHEGGEIASGLTIKAIMQLATTELFTPTTGGDAPDYDLWLRKAVEAANTAVHERSQQSRNDMGTTVVVALMVGDEAHIAHVGDSRAYHITANDITQITTDHSLVERLVATGQISREEARHHPQSNVIYRTIGDKAKIEVDITHAHIAPNEYLLLCSDGLSGMVTDERIHQLTTQAPSPQTACAELINAANAAGGDDNITVIIVKPESLN